MSALPPGRAGRHPPAELAGGPWGAASGERRRLPRPPNSWNAVRPTTAGVWFLVVLVGLLFAAVNTGNNLVYVVLAVLLAVLLVNNVLAEWNLRGLEVRRVLPLEVFAGLAAAGALVLVNPRRIGAAWRVEVEERDTAGRARFGCVPPGGAVEESAEWTLARRGPARIARLRLSSRYPFGLVLRWREVDVPAEVLVYPEPAPGVGARAGAALGDRSVARPARDGTGELVGLRAYAPGDPVRRIHWPSTARAGRPTIVVRGAETGGEVVVRLPDPTEPAIRRACGEILVHTGRGDAVGLDGAGEPIPPSLGASQRRRLLTALALLPPAETP